MDFTDDLNTVFIWMDDLEEVPEVQHIFEYFMIKVWDFSKTAQKYATDYHKYFYGLQTRIERGKSIEKRSNHFQHKNEEFNKKFQTMMEQNSDMVDLLDAKLSDDDFPENVKDVIPEIIDFLTGDLFSIRFAKITNSLLEDMEQIKTDIGFRNIFCLRYIDSYDVVINYTDYLREITPPMCPTCGYRHNSNDHFP